MIAANDQYLDNDVKRFCFFGNLRSYRSAADAAEVFILFAVRENEK